MAKLDKKVLKILKTRQFEDLDAEDIALQIKDGDDQVHEALDSLKTQGLVESIAKEGKTYWRLSADEPLEKPGKFEKSDDAASFDSEKTVSFDVSNLKEQFPVPPKPSQKETAKQISIDFFAVSDPIKPTAAPEYQKPQFHTPETPAPLSEKLKTKPMPPPPPPVIKQEPKAEKSYTHADYVHDGEDDETDHDFRPERTARSFPFGGVAIAIIFSVAISAGMTWMLTDNANKELFMRLDEIEKKISEGNFTQDQRIDKLYQRLNALSEKTELSQPQRQSVAPSRTLKEPPAKQLTKRSHPPRKKKSKLYPSNEERGTTSAVSDESVSSVTPSPSAMESTPPPETAPSATESPLAPPPPAEPETPTPPAEGSSQ